ncbi:3'-5' exonuclease [Corynebacterium sanguinis]|uniref:3'-5' exonuclease n=1 Tax=Corynebacterium sanguinis TaxID=2594913 RepID=A0A6C1TYY6_9CORY|nr:3'-5' exonuclease [Corynebacterium sanguinis]TVS26957.1 3'-5' exonuclease [Corynebacterium sanguinis]
MGFLSSLLNEVMSPGRPVFAVVDTETTGFSAKRDRIIELGVVLIDSNFRECERWSTLINPQKKITNSHIHGITDDMVANAPTFSQVFGEFANKLHGLHLMAHNADFDMKMIGGEIERFDDYDEDSDEVLTLPFIDTIHLAKQLTSGPYKLESLAKKCHVFNPNAHAAVDDAATTAAVMRKLGASKLSLAIKDQGVPFDASIVRTWDLESRTTVSR